MDGDWVRDIIFRVPQCQIGLMVGDWDGAGCWRALIHPNQAIPHVEFAGNTRNPPTQASFTPISRDTRATLPHRHRLRRFHATHALTRPTPVHSRDAACPRPPGLSAYHDLVCVLPAYPHITILCASSRLIRISRSCVRPPGLSAYHDLVCVLLACVRPPGLSAYHDLVRVLLACPRPAGLSASCWLVRVLPTCPRPAGLCASCRRVCVLPTCPRPADVCASCWLVCVLRNCVSNVRVCARRAPLRPGRSAGFTYA